MDAICWDCTPRDDVMDALLEAAEDASLAWDAFANEVALSTDLWRYERSRILDVSASGERLRRRCELLAWRTISSSGTDIPSSVMDPPDVVCFHVTSPEPTRRPGWIATCCALFLTLVVCLALAAAGLVWAVGGLIGRVWTTAGAVTMAVGKVVFSATVDGVDQLNGHHEPASAQSAS